MEKRNTKKDKRHSGRITPNIVKPKMKYNEIKEKALEPQEHYSDWDDCRDGMRDFEGYERKQREKKKFPYKRGGKRRCQ